MVVDCPAILTDLLQGFIFSSGPQFGGIEQESDRAIQKLDYRVLSHG
jgi:hypothetical protein